MIHDISIQDNVRCILDQFFVISWGWRFKILLYVYLTALNSMPSAETWCHDSDLNLQLVLARPLSQMIMGQYFTPSKDTTLGWVHLNVE